MVCAGTALSVPSLHEVYHGKGSAVAARYHGLVAQSHSVCQLATVVEQIVRQLAGLVYAASRLKSLTLHLLDVRANTGTDQGRHSDCAQQDLMDVEISLE
jgi:hypothetical protein